MAWINNVIRYAFHLVKTMLLLISVPVKSCCIIAVGGSFCFFCECRRVCFSGLSAVERGKYLDG